METPEMKNLRVTAEYCLVVDMYPWLENAKMRRIMAGEDSLFQDVIDHFFEVKADMTLQNLIVGSGTMATPADDALASHNRHYQNSDVSRAMAEHDRLYYDSKMNTAKQAMAEHYRLYPKYDQNK